MTRVPMALWLMAVILDRRLSLRESCVTLRAFRGAKGDDVSDERSVPLLPRSGERRYGDHGSGNGTATAVNVSATMRRGADFWERPVSLPSPVVDD